MGAFANLEAGVGLWKKTPELIREIERLLAHDVAGDPVSGLKWTRRTTRKVARELAQAGIHVSANTVARLLRSLGFSLRVNHKKLARSSHPDRDTQFRYIASLREAFVSENFPWSASTPVTAQDSKAGCAAPTD